MGKSPAKWIKGILLGKKSSKSHIAKGREKYTNEKQVLVSAKDSEVDPAVDAPVLSHTSVDKNERKLGVKNNEAASLSHEKCAGNQDTEIQGSTCEDSLFDNEKIRREKAAIKAQAAFRGYLARRALRALRGIIRLQALIRGHLVRRQAVATLSCMLRIVKFQAVIRGRIVRHSDEVKRKCIVVKPMEQSLVDPAEVSLSARMAKFSANIFIFKLVASTPNAKPLQIHYDTEDQNSVFSWLERWSKIQFWKPLPRPKNIAQPKSHKKQGNGQITEVQSVRSKRTRRLPGANNDTASMQTSSEIEKPKRNLRKVSAHPVDQVQENPQSELEKVKRSLRKVHSSVPDNSVQMEAETEKQKETLEKSPGASGRELFESGANNLNEKRKKATPVISNVSNEETKDEPLVMEEILEDQVVADLKPLEEDNDKDQITREEDALAMKVLTENRGNDGNISAMNGELSHKEDSMNGENQKPSKKVLTPAKLEENGLQNSPTLPSYMAATESAKAKLRAQGSPRLEQDTEKNNNIVRRHSLPSSTNGKISSQSPRTQRLVQTAGKSRLKNKSHLPSRDPNGNTSRLEKVKGFAGANLAGFPLSGLPGSGTKTCSCGCGSGSGSECTS